MNFEIRLVFNKNGCRSGRTDTRENMARTSRKSEAKISLIMTTRLSVFTCKAGDAGFEPTFGGNRIFRLYAYDMGYGQ